jgi:colanic acid/amylovoran biosynthesis glycosyltransferase
MRIAYLTRQFPFANLGEAFLFPEVRLLGGMCEEMHVIPARPKLRDSAFGGLETIDVRIAAFGGTTILQALAEVAQHPLRVVRAFWSIVAPRYSISAKIKNLLVFPKALAVARYIRSHHIDHIHVHWLTTPATVAYVASALTRTSWSCTAHAHDIVSDNLVRAKVESASFVRVIAQRNRLHLASIVARDAESLPLIHVGVDTSLEPAGVSSANRPLQIVCAARLDQIKGHEYLLQSLAALRDRGSAFHCDLIGDGPLYEKLSHDIEVLGLQSLVTLRGYVTHGSLLRELSSGRYDVFVLASLEIDEFQHEGIPVALMEAMDAAIPCIATDTGCITELIDERTGVLVPQRDAKALADAFCALARDRRRLKELGRCARARVQDEFDSAKTTQALYELICAETRAESTGLFAGLPVAKPRSIPSPNANWAVGENSRGPKVTSNDSPARRPRNTKSA